MRGSDEALAAVCQLCGQRPCSSYAAQHERRLGATLQTGTTSCRLVAQVVDLDDAPVVLSWLLCARLHALHAA